jgi:Ca2+-binding EF-hand superfamily protein
MHLNKLEKEEHIFKAFQFFDKDNSGYITIEELQEALYENGIAAPGDNSIEEIIKEVDTDNVRALEYWSLRTFADYLIDDVVVTLPGSFESLLVDVDVLILGPNGL